MASDGGRQKSLCNCTALRKATRRVSQLYDSALEPCGLRTTQRAILNHIVRAGTPPLGELAEALVMDRGALTHNLKPLERDGLVEISVDPDDRRVGRLRLTAPAQLLADESRAAKRAALNSALNRLDAHQITDLTKGLDVMSELTRMLAEVPK